MNNFNITIIVAHDKNRLIGNNGKLPWHIKEDLALFKKNTVGNTVIMGRKTWESIGSKPLPDRENLVISNTLTGENIFNTLEEAIEKASSKNVFIIGGSKLYEYVLNNNLVDSIYLSKIKDDYTGDTYFPKIDYNDWDIELISEHKEFDFYILKHF